MNFRRRVFLFGALCFALPTFALAAQDAIIAQDKAEIHEKQDKSSPVLETLVIGSKVRVSEKQKNGWYKVQTKSGKYGWISQINLSILNDNAFSTTSDMALTNTDREDGSHVHKPFFQLLVGGLFGEFLSPTNTNALARDTKHLYPSFAGFIETNFRLSDFMTLGVRGMYIDSVSTASGYTITQSGLPVLVGLNFDLYYSVIWDLSAGIYGGLDMGSKLQINDNANGSNFMSLSQYGNFASLVKVKSRHLLSKKVSLFYELGLYYARGSVQQLQNPYYSYANGVISTAVFEQAGPFLDLGLQFTF